MDVRCICENCKYSEELIICQNLYCKMVRNITADVAECKYYKQRKRKYEDE